MLHPRRDISQTQPCLCNSPLLYEFRQHGKSAVLMEVNGLQMPSTAPDINCPTKHYAVRRHSYSYDNATSYRQLPAREAETRQIIHDPKFNPPWPTLQPSGYDYTPKNWHQSADPAEFLISARRPCTTHGTASQPPPPSSLLWPVQVRELHRTLPPSSADVP